MELKQLYEDNGFPGAKKLYGIARRNGIQTTMKEVKEFVESHAVHQVHKKPTEPNKLSYHPIVAPHPFFNVQADLIDMSNYYKSNDGMKWILIVVDIFTRLAYAEPLQDKTADIVKDGIRKILQQIHQHVSVITTDEGKEFQGGFEKELKQKETMHDVIETGNHRELGVVDRFTRTLKEKIYKHFTNSKSTRWIDVLKTYIKNYNDTEHEVFKDEYTPNEALKHETNVLFMQSERVKDKTVEKKGFNVGDTVRILEKKDVFGKGYESNFSREIYKITKKEGKIGRAHV